MSKPPYLMGDSIKYSYKPKDHHHHHHSHSHKAKGITLLASIFSFFICISIFYVLNHSPDTYTTLFNNNIFWFFMSNILILILAADYEAFSSAKNKQDHLYEEYVKHSQARNNYNYVVTYPEYHEEQVDEKSIIPNPPPPKQQSPISRSDHQISEIVVQNNNPPAKKSSSEKKAVQDDTTTSSRKGCEEKTLFPAGRAVGRSKSDRHGHVKRVVIDESKNRVIRRSETMKKEEAIRVEEENEFSSMTNEELNRRVEEFIQRFNRQIRLQAAA